MERSFIFAGLFGLALFVAFKSSARNIPAFTTVELDVQTNIDGTINLDPGFNGATDTYDDPLTIGTPSAPDLSVWNYHVEPFGLQPSTATDAISNVPQTEIVMTTVSELIADVADYLMPTEAFRSYVYDDANGKPWATSHIGNPTIGYGHKLKPGESVDMIVNTEQAYALLLQDVSDHLLPIIPNVIIPLTLNQWVVVASLAFNAGVTAVLNSQFLKAVNVNDMATAEYQFKDWNKATITVNGVKVKRVVAGLVTRRDKEWALFLTPQQVVMLDNTSST